MSETLDDHMVTYRVGQQGAEDVILGLLVAQFLFHAEGDESGAERFEKHVERLNDQRTEQLDMK
ncbi:hypothetical protein [Halocatena marina]|nr:hypothetical protein [Halocatena marina]